MSFKKYKSQCKSVQRWLWIARRKTPKTFVWISSKNSASGARKEAEWFYIYSPESINRTSCLFMGDSLWSCIYSPVLQALSLLSYLLMLVFYSSLISYYLVLSIFRLCHNLTLRVLYHLPSLFCFTFSLDQFSSIYSNSFPLLYALFKGTITREHILTSHPTLIYI